MSDILSAITDVVQVKWLAIAILAIIILVATAIVSRTATTAIHKLLSLSDGKGLPSSSIFENIVRVAIWVIGVCLMLSTCFGVDVSAAITALGIGGVAISLGAKDTLSNLIGGLQVSVMRIVSPGDRVRVGTSTGTVTDVTWRHTTMHSSAGEDVVIPNSVINTTALVHLSAATKAEVPLVVPASVGDIDAAAAAIEQAATSAAAEVAVLTKEPKLTFSGIDPSGFKGTLTFSVEDGETTAGAIDAVIRAIAPLVVAQAQPEEPAEEEAVYKSDI